MEAETLHKLLKRLDILISLQMSPVSWNNSSDQDRIELLGRFGLKPSEIAEILNSSGDKVSKQLYAIKTKRKVTKNEK